MQNPFKRAPVQRPEVASVVENQGGAGVLPRVFPVNVNQVFRQLPRPPYTASGGVSSPVAYRPNSAPMLDSSSYYSEIPAIGLNLGIPSRPFKRGTMDVHPAAVSDAVHVRGSGVHPTIRRKVLMGDKSL